MHRLLLVVSFLGLFLQLFHLYWLTTVVVVPRFFGFSLDTTLNAISVLYLLADGIEVPAILSRTFLYILGMKSDFSWKNVLLLVLLNSQWIHIYWITDTFILSELFLHNNNWPIFLIWGSILIDYLELPVIYDTGKEVFLKIKHKRGL